MFSGVVHLTSKTIYGMSSRGIPQYLFQPFDTAIEPFLVGCSEKDRTTNLLAVASIADTTSRIWKGVIVKVLGKCGDKTAEEEALLWRYCQYRWTAKSLKPVSIPPVGDRMSLDAYPTINIDPAGCMDIDDCVSIWEEDGRTHVAITIADVHEWVCHNMWLVEKASAIGQTFYKDGKVMVPMLPSQLSDDMCSLKPGVRRLGLAMLFEWKNGVVHDTIDFKPVTILNKKTYTYESVSNATDFPVSTLRAIAEHLTSTTASLSDPHDWIAALMIFYNTEAAKRLWADRHGVFRSHSPPDAFKLEHYAMWNTDLKHLAYGSATYSETNPHHWGLCADTYCHASSPIRRWADVVNQSYLKGKPLPYTLNTLNIQNKHAKHYERDMVFLTAAMETHDYPITAIVLSSTEKRSRVWVPSWKRMMTAYDQTFAEGTIVRLHYFLNLNAPTWKKRLVIKCEDTGCRVQRRPSQSSAEHPEEAPTDPGPV